MKENEAVAAIEELVTATQNRLQQLESVPPSQRNREEIKRTSIRLHAFQDALTFALRLARSTMSDAAAQEAGRVWCCANVELAQQLIWLAASEDQVSRELAELSQVVFAGRALSEEQTVRANELVAEWNAREAR